LSDLGFELERDGFDYGIRERREKHDLPTLQPTKYRDLEAIIELFKTRSQLDATSLFNFAQPGEALRRFRG
jgi:hypothetical protein